VSHGVYIFAVWLHILSAIIWIGGALFLSLVLVPVMKHLPDAGLRLSLIRNSGVRFRAVSWICFLVFVVTGLVALAWRGITLSRLATTDFWTGSFGRTLGEKLALVLVILVLSALHDFVLGPRAAAYPGLPRLRSQAIWIARVNLLLGLLAAALGVMLVRGRPW
jgi:putative copper resistance protein D